MQINKNYYVYESTVNNLQLAYAMTASQYKLNQKIDESATIAAAGSIYSAWNNHTLICNAEYERVSRDTLKLLSYSRTNCPIFLFKIYNTQTAFRLGALGQTIKNGYNAWGYDVSNKNNIPQANNKPIIGFAYNQLIAKPNIYAYKLDKTTSKKFDYGDYFGTQNEIDYPYIACVTVQFYQGNTPRTKLSDIEIMPEFNGEIARFINDTTLTKKNVLLYSAFTGSYSSETVIFGADPSSSVSQNYATQIFVGDLSAAPIEFFESTRYLLTFRRYYDNTDKSGGDYFRKVVNASCPFFWAETESIAQNTKIDDTIQSSKMHLPIITDSGVLTDKDVVGVDIKKAKQFTWSKPEDVFKNNGWRGEDFIDPNTYTDKIDLPTPKLTTLDVFNRSFAITKNELDILANFLWNADESIFTEIVNGLKLFGENPINGIINLRLYPFDIAAKLSATGTQKIVIGRTNTGVDGIRLPENSNAIIDVGECTFFRNFRNFLDYEPYTHAQLYIPYVGTIPIPTSEFMGHTIKCKLIADMVTGACTAVVFKNDIPMIYQQGVLGIDIPITGDNAAAYANSVLNGVIGAIPGLQQTAGQPAKSGQGGKASTGIANTIYAASGVASATMSLYEGFAQGTMYQSSGSSSPACAIWTPQKPYFIVSRPIINAPDNYGAVVGYACEYEDNLSNVSGFTVCANPKIGFAKSQIENDMINQYLESGVYL